MHIMARAMQQMLQSFTHANRNPLRLSAHQGRVKNPKVRRKGTIMFCNGCNNSSLWLIILIIILFGCGNGCGNGCGCSYNNCGCDNNCGCGC